MKERQQSKLQKRVITPPKLSNGRKHSMVRELLKEVRLLKV